MTELVGILNLTPDSFSDGGRYPTAKAIIDRMDELVAQGADIIDLGAESTRPGAMPLSADEEWARLAPLCMEIGDFHSVGVTVSVDTRHAVNAKRMIDHGVRMINDVTGFSDPAMIKAVKDQSVDLVVMHSLGIPADPKHHIGKETDVLLAMLKYAEERIDALVTAGISKNRIIFDPGIGFGKSAQQSIALIHHAATLHVLDVPVYMGHSRKSFLEEWPGEADRDTKTLEVSRVLVQKNVSYLRVHDVSAHRKLLQEMGE